MVRTQIEPAFFNGLDYSSIWESLAFLRGLFPSFLVEETSIILKREKDIEYLSQIYDFSDPHEIKGFLLRNHFLIDLVLEANEKISEFFGTDIKKALEITTDPDENFEELFIVIKSNYSAEKARTLLNSLMDEWFLDVIDRTRGLLNITEETA
jgi:hypothetical protein